MEEGGVTIFLFSLNVLYLRVFGTFDGAKLCSSKLFSKKSTKSFYKK